MKITTCRNLRGACDEPIHGETPEEMAEKSKEHVMAQLQAGDTAHQEAVNNMMALSKDEQIQWFNNFVDQFDTLEEA